MIRMAAVIAISVVCGTAAAVLYVIPRAWIEFRYRMQRDDVVHVAETITYQAANADD